MRMIHLIAKIVKKTLMQKTNETLINLFKCGVIMGKSLLSIDCECCGDICYYGSILCTICREVIENE